METVQEQWAFCSVLHYKQLSVFRIQTYHLLTHWLALRVPTALASSDHGRFR